jgi:hypothetical protein
LKEADIMKQTGIEKKINKSISRKDFESFLDKQDLKKQAENQDDWVRRKNNWLRRIEKFYNIIQGLLKEYLDHGKVNINFRPLTLNEEYIGSYETEKLYLMMGHQEIVFSPVGTRIFGCRGRIDMEGSAGKVRFLLVDKASEGVSVKTRIYIDGEIPKENNTAKKEITWTWKIATPPPELMYVDLNEESFFDALMEVING